MPQVRRCVAEYLERERKRHLPLLAARLEEEDSEAPTPAPTQDRLTLWSTGEMGAALSARGVALGSLRLPNVTDSDVDGCVDCLQAGGDCLEAAAYGAAVLPDWEEDHAAGHARMRRGLERAADAREPGGCTLVVTHGDCLQAAAQHFLGQTCVVFEVLECGVLAFKLDDGELVHDARVQLMKM